MDPEVKEIPGETVAQRADPMRFYRKRQRFSLCLMIFIVIVGIPILGVPSLRNRLSTRVMALKAALAGVREPQIVDVGYNREPVPEEYQKPEPVIPRPPVLAGPDKVYVMDAPVTVARPPVSVSVRPRIQRSAGQAQELEETEEPALPDEADAASGEEQVQYQRGRAERDAYDLLLQSRPGIAEMVEDKNPAFRFRSWDAAHRGEDTYWVRIKFQSEGIDEAEYIWVVRVAANQVSPLNFNARSLPQ